MLPYAVPGLITFVVGLVLCLLGAMRIFRGERIGYYLSFSGTCIGFGVLGLVLALRSVVRDPSTLITWNTYLYSFVILLAPASSHLVDHIFDFRYRIPLRIGAGINWAVTFIALVGIFQGRAFTGDFLHYSFGNYPVASNFLKPWGICAALTFVVLGIPVYIHYLRRNSLGDKVYVVAGHTTMLVLIISNLPSLLGFPIFPGSTLAFVPMCVLAYGVFNSDFKDLKQLLFEKNGLFYILNVFLGLVLFALSVGVIFFLSPGEYLQVKWYPWLLIPLVSVFLTVGLGIFVGGTNPGKPLNQLGAFSLYLAGFQLLATIAVNLATHPLIGQRIEQLCYLLFCFVPSIQLRFAFLSLRLPLPRWVPVLDAVSLLLAALSLSPFLFTGYYQFPWGRISSAGPVIQALGFVGLAAIAYGIRRWWMRRKEGAVTRLGDFAMFYLVAAGLMLLCNLPATMGFNIYPLGNLAVIPTGILAYAVLRYGEETIKTESFRISSYLVPFAVITVIFLLFVISSALPMETDVASRSLHLMLAGIPLVLLSFLATFVLIRPIASQVDAALVALHEAVEVSKRQKNEIETISEFSKRLNAKLDLDPILDDVFSYFESRYGFEAVILQFLDREKNEFYTYKTTAPEKATEDMLAFGRSMRLPVDERIGILYPCVQKVRTLYLPRLTPEIQPPIIREMINRLELKSFLFVPLVIQDDIIGCMFFTSYRRKLSLTKNDINNISIFCNQVSTSLQNSRLFQQVQSEREKSEKLLLNILPEDVALDLKEKGFSEPEMFDSVSVMFTDFQGFTRIAESLTPQELIKDLDACFVQFDRITERYNLEKLKTIGDSYMCAGGVPRRNATHAIDCVLAAIEIQQFMNLMKEIKEQNGFPFWELRLGIHTGSLVAGVIGEKKFAYDVWGDTVNTASRIESSGSTGKINISKTTYDLVGDFFECEHRGRIAAKNKGDIDMYYVHGLKRDYSAGEDMRTPNERFWTEYKERQAGQMKVSVP